MLASHLINCNIFKYLPPKREPEVVHSEGTGNELLQQKTAKEKTYQNTYVGCNKLKILPLKWEPEVVHSEGTGNELLQQKILPKKKPIKTLMSTAKIQKICRLNNNRK